MGVERRHAQDGKAGGLFAFGRVLVLGPHVDDAEFGCGGTISRLVEMGANVRCIAFSDARRSTPSGFTEDALEKEAQAAAIVLNLTRLEVKSYDVRHFLRERQAILEELITVRNEFDPQLVFLPSTNDIHQDHVVIRAEGERAFKGCTILGYEMPWNNVSFTATCLVSLDESEVNKKIEAIDRYQSQKFRAYADPEFIRSLARVRGVQIGVPYAEAFEVIRWVVR